MNTPQAEMDKKDQIREARKKFLEEIVAASARYERLMANSDFVAVLGDLKNIVDLHENEIRGFLKAYTLASSFFKKMRLAEVMGQHQLKKDQIEEAINYPRQIVEQANIAREELAKMKAQEKENSNV